jgi:hypothetical protein
MALKWNVNYLRLKQREYILKHNQSPCCKSEVSCYTVGNNYGKVETWYCKNCHKECQ